MMMVGYVTIEIFMRIEMRENEAISNGVAL
jgi:hypothetical protein